MPRNYIKLLEILGPHLKKFAHHCTKPCPETTENYYKFWQSAYKLENLKERKLIPHIFLNHYRLLRLI